MTINLVRLRGVERQLERLNRNIEALLAEQGLFPRAAEEPPAEDVSAVAYTDEEADAIKAMEQMEVRRMRDLPEDV
jgi:hypothetical protein